MIRGLDPPVLFASSAVLARDRLVLGIDRRGRPARALLLFRRDGLDVELGGHTDNLGDANANMLLSILRVNSVRDALVSRGIELARILTVGYGETRPIADNSTPDGRRANRRTEFLWLE